MIHNRACLSRQMVQSFCSDIWSFSGCTITPITVIHNMTHSLWHIIWPFALTHITLTLTHMTQLIWYIMSPFALIHIMTHLVWHIIWPFALTHMTLLLQITWPFFSYTYYHHLIWYIIWPLWSDIYYDPFALINIITHLVRHIWPFYSDT